MSALWWERFVLPEVSFTVRYWLIPDGLSDISDALALVTPRVGFVSWCTTSEMGKLDTPTNAMRHVEKLLGLPEYPVRNRPNHAGTARHLNEDGSWSDLNKLVRGVS